MNPQNSSPLPDRLLRAAAVREYLGGMSHGSLYDKMNVTSPRHDPTFPTPYRTGPRAVAWKFSELQAWVETRKNVRGQQAGQSVQGVL